MTVFSKIGALLEDMSLSEEDNINYNLLNITIDKILKSIDKSEALPELQSCQTLVDLFYQKYNDNNMYQFFNWKISQQKKEIFSKMLINEFVE